MKNRMKSIGRLALTALASAILTTVVITACGGGSSGGGVIEQARAFIFNSSPFGLHVTSGFGSSRRAGGSSPFTVNAQAPTPGGGNFPGFCNSVNPSSGRAATVLFGLGLWSSGDCATLGLPDTNVGVAIPANGQIGQLTVDALGQGSGADDGKIGSDSTGSGQIQGKIIHQDGTQTVLALSCTLGVSNPGARVHCEDKNAAHNTNVIAGDQVAIRFWYNSGDSYNAIRVNVQYATPTF